jgi:PKD repeat protein
VSSRIPRRIPILLALATGVALALPAAADAAPPASATFSVSPGSPGLNEATTFTPNIDWAGTPGTIEWNFGDGATATATATADNLNPATTHAYATTGTRTVTMRATNGEGSILAPPTQVTVPNVGPVVGFSFAPISPFTGDDVQFASSSFDPGGSIASYDWDFGDGASSPLPNPLHPYSTPGTKTVTLTVTDADGASSFVSHSVVVSATANKPPVAGFAFSPTKPKVGQQVEFVSSAVDPDGRLQDQRWDLDGDGQFDDARGDDVLYTFPTSGLKTVRLRVEDNSGGAAVKERTIQVAPGPPARPGFLNPFPVVRITGEVRGSGALVRLLSVRAPRGALAAVQCTGKGCPTKRRRHRLGRSHLARFKAYERQLRAGVRLEVFVSKPGTIGKYTRFTIRAHASPKRIDRCLVPGKAKPTRCPS